MEIPKEQILSLLREQGQHDQADEADGQLPDQVDTEEHGDLLSQVGVSPADLISKFAGGGLGGELGGLGGLGGKLGL